MWRSLAVSIPNCETNQSHQLSVVGASGYWGPPLNLAKWVSSKLEEGVCENHLSEDNMIADLNSTGVWELRPLSEKCLVLRRLSGW